MGEESELKALLLCAGRTIPSKVNLWPENAKPKCLFHVRGEVLLERQVRILREVGIDDIRVVVGYKKEMIEKFNEEKKLGLELVYNPTAESDRKAGSGWVKGLDSVKVGLEGVNDDVLIMYGDLYLKANGLKRVLEEKSPCVSVYSGHGCQMFKTSKELLPLLRKFNGVGIGTSLRKFCMRNNGVEIILYPPEVIHDIDFYPQTDEYKLEHKK